MSTNTENKIDLNKPVTADEIQARISELSEAQLAQARQQQVDNALLNPKPKADAPKLGSMSDAELRRYTMENFGF